MSRRALAVLSAIVLAAGLVTLTAAPAQAAPTLLTCSGNQAQTYTPGLTMPQRPTLTTGVTSFSNCTGTTGPINGTAVRGFASNQGCLQGALTGPFTFVVGWDHGGPSTVRATDLVVTRVLGQTAVVLTGTVIAGQFIGATYTEAAVLFNVMPAACLAEPGVLSAAGPVVLVLGSAI
ncbi:hypothetical protein [Micromonospora sp. SH-82]|uniref:hypothetical protein n=1 Tax=Micromonospora sp. SH-82 TaxID=3132938 RepID=UPI003EBA32E6